MPAWKSILALPDGRGVFWIGDSCWAVFWPRGVEVVPKTLAKSYLTYPLILMMPLRGARRMAIPPMVREIASPAVCNDINMDHHNESNRLIFLGQPLWEHKGDHL